uniref:BY PROTMAP: gi/647395163/emb/CDR36385.1/ RHTO0S02e01420g1_1 [Rhodosporidium toruloides] n=1 Tax=Rhodotorula toruloides TaxID=5286 RepID=A0A0K3CVR0_RHOTO
MAAFLHVKFGSGRPPEHAHQLPFAHEIEEDPTRTALHDSLKTDVQRSGVIRYLEQNFKEGSYVHDVVSSRESEHGMYALVCKNWARSVGDPKLHLSLYIYQDDRHVATWHAYTDRSISYSRTGDENDPPPDGAGADPYSTAEALEAAASRAPTPAPGSPDADRPRFNRPAAAPDSDEDGVEPPFETNGLSSKPASPASAEPDDSRSRTCDKRAIGESHDVEDSEDSPTTRKAAPSVQKWASEDANRANSPERPAEASRSSRSARRQRRNSTSLVEEAAEEAYPIVKSKPIGRTSSRRSPSPSPPPSSRPERTARSTRHGSSPNRADGSDEEASELARGDRPDRRQRSQRRREPSPDERTPSPPPDRPSRSPSPAPAQPSSHAKDRGRRTARTPSPAERKSSRSPSPVAKDTRAAGARRSSRRRRSPSPDAIEGEEGRGHRGRGTTKPKPASAAPAPAPLERTPSWRSVSRNRHRRDDSDEDTLVRGNLDDHELDIPAGGETTLLEAKRRSASKDRSARRARHEPKDEGFDPKEVEKPAVPPPKPTAKAVLGEWLKSVGTLLKIEGELAAGEVEQKVLEHEVDDERARAQRKEERRLRREARAARRAARAKQEEEEEARKSRRSGRAAAEASDNEAGQTERKEEKKVDKRRDQEREREDAAVVSTRDDRSSRRSRRDPAEDKNLNGRPVRNVSPDSPAGDVRRERSSRHRHHGSSNVESPSELDDEEAPPSRRSRAMSVSATLDKGMQNLRKSVVDIVSNVSGTREDAKPPRHEEERRHREGDDDDNDDLDRRRRRERQQRDVETGRPSLASRRRPSLSDDEQGIHARPSRNDGRSPPRPPIRKSYSDSDDAQAPSRSARSRSRRRAPRPPSPSESSAAETVSTRRRNESPESVDSRRNFSPDSPDSRRRGNASQSEEEKETRRSKQAVPAPPAPGSSARYARAAYDREQSPPRSTFVQRDRKVDKEVENLPRRIIEDVEHIAAEGYRRTRHEVEEVEDKVRRVERRDDRRPQGSLNDPYSRIDLSSRRLSPLATGSNKHDPSALPPIVSPHSPIRIARAYASNESPIRPQPVRPASYRTTVSRPTSSAYRQNQRDKDESSDASRPAGRRARSPTPSDDEADYSRRLRQSAAQPPATASQGAPYRFPPPSSAPSSAAFSDGSFRRSDLDSTFDSEPESQHRNVRSAAPSPSLSPEPEPVKQRGRNLSFTRSKGESYDPFGSSSEESEDSEEEEREREREQERWGGGGGGSRTTVGDGARGGQPSWDRRNDTYGGENEEEVEERRPFSRTTVGKPPSHVPASASTASRMTIARPSTFSPTASSRSPYAGSYNDSYDSRFSPPSHSSSRYSPFFQDDDDDDDPRFSPSQSPAPYTNVDPSTSARTRMTVEVSGSAQTFGRFGAPVSRRAARRLGL